jgi:hypothetical protein
VLEETLCGFLVIDACALDEGDRLREHAAIAAADAVRERVDVGHGAVARVAVTAASVGRKQWMRIPDTWMPGHEG